MIEVAHAIARGGQTLATTDDPALGALPRGTLGRRVRESSRARGEPDDSHRTSVR
ncbi:MAG: hypothetical protein ACKO2C_03405 [Actinomycetes bacterium]